MTSKKAVAVPTLGAVSDVAKLEPTNLPSPERGRNDMRTPKSRGAPAAAAELAPLHPDDDYPVEGTVAMRYDVAEGHTEFTATIDGQPLTEYDLVVLVPKPESAGAVKDVEFTGGSAMVFSPVHVAVPGAKLGLPLYQSLDENAVLFSALPHSRGSFLTGANSLGALPESSLLNGNALPLDCSGPRQRGVLCCLFTDEDGHAEVTRTSESIRLLGPPGVANSIIGRWFGVAERASNSLVALGRTVATTTQ
jgi:hypothetical protein